MPGCHLYLPCNGLPVTGLANFMAFFSDICFIKESSVYRNSHGFNLKKQVPAVSENLR